MTERRLMQLVRLYGLHSHGVGYYGDRDEADMKECEAKAKDALKQIRLEVKLLVAKSQVAK